MKILVCGADGFVGRHICRALQSAGHRVISGVSPDAEQVAPDRLRTDFVHDLAAQTWLPRLVGVDAVVNAVGLLRDSTSRPMRAVQAVAPIALFDACVQAGVRRLVQISALGIDGADTPYARTKREAEQTLEGLADAGRLDPIVLRPSVIFGRGGDSSALFMNLAKLPLLVLPGPVLKARVQPIAIDELAEAVALLVGVHGDRSGRLDCVGPEAVAMGDFVASLRRQNGHAAAPTLRLPDLLTRISAKVGDVVPPSPWCSETLAMLASDNVAPSGPFAQLLGRQATRYDALVAHAWRRSSD